MKMAGSAQRSAHPKNLEVMTMLDDPIVEEVRKNGQAFVARYNYDLAAICMVLKAKEGASGRIVVNRAMRRLAPKKAQADSALQRPIPSEFP